MEENTKKNEIEEMTRIFEEGTKPADDKRRKME
jgi:hypothetical protein